MKKTIVFIVIVISLLVLIGCGNKKDDYKVYAVVHYESNFIGGTTDKIILGNKYSSEGKKSTVYYYNDKKQEIQLQPNKIGNTINNVNSEWQAIKSIESLGLKNVYYNNGVSYTTKLELVNDSEIEVFKITIHQKFGSIIHIEEIYVIEIHNITNFDFKYKVEELE